MWQNTMFLLLVEKERIHCQVLFRHTASCNTLLSIIPDEPLYCAKFELILHVYQLEDMVCLKRNLKR